MRTLTVALLALGISTPALAQRSAQQQFLDEQHQQILTLIQADARERADDLYMPTAVTWTSTYAEPSIVGLRQAPVERDTRTGTGRTNQEFVVTPERISISNEFAWEYSTWTLTYDDSQGHTNVSGALFRFWERRNGSWKIAGLFQRPYGQLLPAETPTERR